MKKKRVDYTPIQIEEMSPKEIRKTYSELRKVATLRQKRLKAAFPRSALTGTGKWWKFPTTKSMKSTQKVAEALAEVSRFLTNPLSTVTAQKKQIQELHEEFAGKFGIEISKEEIPQFFGFMDELRARYGAKMVDSARVAEAFQMIQKKNISMENVKKEFSFYMEHMTDIDKLKLNPDRKRKYTSTELRAKLRGIGIYDVEERQTRKPEKRPVKRRKRR